MHKGPFKIRKRWKNDFLLILAEKKIKIKGGTQKEKSKKTNIKTSKHQNIKTSKH